MENNCNVVESVAKTIANYSGDIVIDFLELALDSFFENPLLRELPIVKTFASIARIGFAIREKHLLRKTIIFINQLNANSIDNAKYEKYKSRIKKKDKKLYSELEIVLIIIDRLVDERKSIILANLFFNYIDRTIDWEDFLELSLIVDNLFINDIPELKMMYEKNAITMNEIVNKTSFNRLKNQNLIDDINSISRDSNGNINTRYNENDYQISVLGIRLYELGINYKIKE